MFFEVRCLKSQIACCCVQYECDSCSSGYVPFTNCCEHSTKFLFLQTIWNKLTAGATSRRKSAPHSALHGKRLDYKSACVTTVTHGTDVGDILPEGQVDLFQRDGGLKKNLHIEYF